MTKEFGCSQNPSLLQFTELEFCSGLFGYMQQFALEFPTFLENQMAKTKKLQKF